MLAISDVHHLAEHAFAACVVAERWDDPDSVEEQRVRVERGLPYEPGRFYLRELPGLLEVLGTLRHQIDSVVIDGYVYLGAGKPGLGAQLYDRLAGRVSVVGVAKSAYRGSEHAIPVQRGTSRRPLFVTARGMAAERAAELVHGMHGAHRIPSLLARADALARRG